MSDSHGNSPAAWTGVAVATLGFLIASIGIMTFTNVVTVIGLVIAPVGGLVGYVMGRAAKSKGSPAR